jgi:hypothetical protein
MSLESWYYIGELVGVGALIVSVLYLAKQVKNANDLNRTNTFRSIFQGLAAFSNEMFGPENAELLVKGYRDLSSLTPAERLRFDNLMSNYFNYVEDSFSSAQVELLGAETMENWAWWLRNRFFPYKGVHDWWAAGKELWPPAFRNWVDKQAGAAQPSDDVYGIVNDR